MLQLDFKDVSMITKTIIVQNRAGIHARPASLIVEMANKFQSSIMIEKAGISINARSIMGVMTMAAGYQTELLITAEGSDEAEAIAAFEQLFATKFEED